MVSTHTYVCTRTSVRRIHTMDVFLGDEFVARIWSKEVETMQTES